MSGPRVYPPTVGAIVSGDREYIWPRQTRAERDAEILATLHAAWRDHDDA